MTQAHMDRLTALDASFLSNESPRSHMHIGALTIFAGPAPSYEELLAHVESRLHLVPRYRQKLAVPPLETGRPFWVDDQQFNIGYHVRHSALPPPGGEVELRRIAARVFSQQLDRTKPLWELWLIEGLRKDHFALISKTHHALIDGIAGVDIGTVLFDLTPVTEPVPAAEEWVPETEPSRTTLAMHGLEAASRAPLDLARRAVSAATSPRNAARRAQDFAEAFGEVARELASPAPDVPLNRPIGPHRRYAWVRGELADYKRIKKALGGTVNDVVLCVVAGALRRWLHEHDVRTQGLELRALVPVSIRATDEHGELGNQIAAVRGPLPVYVEDPVVRLRTVRGAMEGIKSSKKALGAEMITRFNDFAPPTLLAQAARLNFSTRLFNLIVTNVPGPQIPLYVLGRELLDVFPIAFLPENHALAIAIMSYNGKIDFGLLGDFDSMADIELLSEGIEAELELLLEATAAREGSAGNGGKRAGKGGKRAAGGAKRPAAEGGAAGARGDDKAKAEG